MMDHHLEFIEDRFELPGPVVDISSLGSGHIHDTYLISCSGPDSPKFVLQKFNQQVFNKPLEVMSNISRVLEHIAAQRGTGNLKPMHIVRTREGDLIYKDREDHYYRIFNYIGQSDSFDRVTNPEQAMGGAKAFGQFLELLKELDPAELYTTIPDFHHLGVRYQQLQQAVSADSAHRVAQHRQEVDFALERESRVLELCQLLNNPEVPYRVTHNDTKINNVLFKKDTTEGICVVDLDTIMPGLLLFDFGDMARTFCNSVLEEDEADQVVFRLGIFESLCRGFFSSIHTPPDQQEIESLKAGPWWLTYIMAIRFLADFLAGDVYYKISYPNQNLDRARNQLKLVKEIEDKQPEIDLIIERFTATAHS